MDFCDTCEDYVEGNTHEVEYEDGTKATCCDFCNEPIRTFNEDPDWR